MLLQADISRNKNLEFVGKKYQTLIEKSEEPEFGIIPEDVMPMHRMLMV